MSFQPPAATVTEMPEQSYGGNGSTGPVIGVLAVILVLAVVAAIVGRLCSGRSVFGYGHEFDVEGWIERKCASCIDGRVESRPPAPPPPPQAEAVTAPAADGGCDQASNGRVRNCARSSV